MKNFLFILALVTGPSLFALGGTVTIKGVAEKDYWNTTLKAYTFDDYISGRQKQLGSTAIDEKGYFTLTLNTPVTIFVMLRVENKQATLYCEPGSSYEVKLLAKDPDAVETVGVPVPVNLTFNITDTMELNFLIFRYDYYYDQFVERKASWTMKDAIEFEKRIDTFCVRVKRKFAYAHDAYFQDYIDYTCAGLKLTFKKNETLYKEYIEHRPVQYNHQEYMNFLNAFLSNVLDGAAASAEMKKQVNNIESLADISKYIGGLKYTGRDTLRELGIAKVLEMEFNDPSFKKEHLAGLLAAASTAFKTEENKKIAANLNYKFGRLLPGNTALPLSGTDMTGKTVSLGDFKGKYVYVAFFRSDCRVCEEQFRLIADYKRKYGSKIEFLYVSIDKDPGEVKKFLERYPKTNWPVIVTSDEKVKEDYGIVAIPLYYLITPQGTFMQSPAAEPGVDIEKVFDSILKKK